MRMSPRTRVVVTLAFLGHQTSQIFFFLVAQYTIYAMYIIITLLFE